MPRPNLPDIANLERLKSDELRSLWPTLVDSSIPAHASRELMTRVLGYRLQEQATKVSTKSLRRRLIKLAGNFDEAADFKPTPPTVLKSGTRLIREWQGESHEVVVRDQGVEYSGRQYASLSQVARIITGTRWSGPLFFGIRKIPSQRKEVNHGR